MIIFKKLRHFKYGGTKIYNPFTKKDIERVFRSTLNGCLEYWELTYDSETRYVTQPINVGRILFNENRYPAQQVSDLSGRWVMLHGTRSEYGATIKLSQIEFINLFGNNPNEFFYQQTPTFNLIAVKMDSNRPIAGVSLKDCFIKEITHTDEHFGLEIKLSANYIHTEYYDTPNNDENESYNQNNAPSHFCNPRS